MTNDCQDVLDLPRSKLRPLAAKLADRGLAAASRESAP